MRTRLQNGLELTINTDDSEALDLLQAQTEADIAEHSITPTTHIGRHFTFDEVKRLLHSKTLP